MPGLPASEWRTCRFRYSSVIYHPHPSELLSQYEPRSLDAMAFSVVVFVNFGTGLSFAHGEWLPGGRPGILRTIFEDATVYFLVIFSSHLLVLVVVLVSRVSLNIPLKIWKIGDQSTQPSLKILPGL